MLATSDAEWRTLTPLTGAADQAELERLRAHYRARHPARRAGPAEQQAAARLYQISGENRRPGAGRLGHDDRHRERSGRQPILSGSRRDRRTRFAAWTAPGRLLSLPAVRRVWELAARLIGSPLLPPASAVFAARCARPHPARCPRISASRSARVAAAFVIAMVLGSALGLAMGRWRRSIVALDSWVWCCSTCRRW